MPDKKETERRAPLLPKELEVILYNRCLLRCAYCRFHKLRNERPRRLSFKKFRLGIARYIEAARSEAMEIGRIGFVGGETFLSKALLRKAVDHVREVLGPRVVIEVQTCGVLLDPETTEFLLSRRVKLVLRFDGMQEDNDLNRIFFSAPEKTVFGAVIKRLKTLSPSQMSQIYCALTFTPQTVARLGENVRFLHGLGFCEVRLNNMGTVSVWTERGLASLRQGLRSLKRFYTEFLRKHPRHYKHFRLGLDYLVRIPEITPTFGEMILSHDGVFYPGSIIPFSAQSKRRYGVGSAESGIDLKKMVRLKKKMVAFISRYDKRGYLKKDLPNPQFLYYCMEAGRMPPALTVRSNGKAAQIVREEINAMIKLETFVDRLLSGRTAEQTQT